MARTKRVLLRRKGKVIKEPAFVPNVIEKKRPVVKVRANRWSRTDERINTPNPERNDLTSSQWVEWGEGLRTLRGVDYQEAQTLSLVEMRTVLESIRRCTTFRVVHG